MNDQNPLSWPLLSTRPPHPLHHWVEIQYTPVEVHVGEDGRSLHVTVSTVAQELAKEDAQYGCWICGELLTTASYETACIPPKIIK